MYEPLINPWPCIGGKGFELFATTADQRFLLGEDLFLSTHTPVVLRRFHPTGEAGTIHENDILRYLTQDVPNKIGNRVIVLYGAAGSGKSELIRWLQLMMQRQVEHRVNTTIRIPRTELDVLSITERFQHLLTNQWFSESTHSRWKEAQKKPRAIAKLILLTALTNMLDTDEAINGLYYRLLEWIEPRITRILNASFESDETSSIPLDIITREDLEEFHRETTLSIQLEYEKFRYMLLMTFREHLLESTHLPTTLRRISDNLNKQGIRPVLLIDDLVQSINLFATDILDYVITLEEGNWDVVIGLTPDALTSDDRGRELLDRINYLDTIDDRIEKLWLSDMKGHESYNLNSDNYIGFIHRYLIAYRKENGWECLSCHLFNTCKQLELNSSDNGRILAPFNATSLFRIFAHLPDGKGQARQFLSRIRTILEKLFSGIDLISAMGESAKLEFAAEAKEEVVARLAEIYYPIVEDGEHEIPGGFWEVFGLPNQPQTITLYALNPNYKEINRTAFLFEKDDDLYNDPTRREIKAWLDMKPVNRHALQQLRRGIARWVRTIYPIDGLYRENVARPNNILRWNRVYLDVRPPICFDDVDSDTGILISREIGLTAFLLSDFANAVSPETRRYVYYLARDERAISIIYSAYYFQQKLKDELESQLEMPLDELALHLYLLSISLRPPIELRPPGLTRWPFWSSTNENYNFLLNRNEVRLLNACNALFDDFFKLRDNVYDGQSLLDLMSNRSPETVWSSLLRIDPSRLHSDFVLDERPLAEQISKAQLLVQRLLQFDEKLKSFSKQVSIILETLTNPKYGMVYLNSVPTSVWEEIQTKYPELFAALQVSIDKKSL